MCEFWQVDSHTCVCASSLIPVDRCIHMSEVPRVAAADLGLKQVNLDLNPA